jgi:N-acetylglucosaminyldiphosphoundecaprenol N-acetyl-beta-D-mannosaminyltransferase
MAKPPRVTLLDLDFTDVTPAEAVALIAAREANAPFRYVVTPNSDHLVRLARQPALLPVYRDAAMCLMDSRVVARAAGLLGLPVPRVTTGSDLTERLLTGHVMPGEPVTIIGLREAHLPALVARCGIAPPAHFDPPMGFARDPVQMQRVVDFVLEHPARLVFLAVGSPQQELLAAAVAATGRAVGTGLCIGASLDFLAGKQQRAPAWVQRAGLEWLHRLAGDPQRLARRYLRDNPPVFALLLRERFARARPAPATLREPRGAIW